MHFEILVEDQSGKTVLDILVPKISLEGTPTLLLKATKTDEKSAHFPLKFFNNLQTSPSPQKVKFPSLSPCLLQAESTDS